MAAVKNQELLARTTAVHGVGDEGGRDGRGLGQIALGILGSQVQPALVVQQAMAGKVEQQHIVGPGAHEEAGDCPAGLGLRLVDQGQDVVELPDVGVAQQVGE